MPVPRDGLAIRRWLEAAKEGHGLVDLRMLLTSLAESGIASRLQAARRHSEELAQSIAANDAPEFDERDRQEAYLYELFGVRLFWSDGRSLIQSCG
jgi:hypothetical protein